MPTRRATAELAVACPRVAGAVERRLVLATAAVVVALGPVSDSMFAGGGSGFGVRGLTGYAVDAASVRAERGKAG
jgi:hypothetical protein